MKQKLVRILADLRFSIFLLLLICLTSILGTIIEQDQSIETYKQNYPLINPVLGFLSWDFILKYELDHVYKTWWFISLIFVFGSSLILCSFFQQLPSIQIARRCQFFRNQSSFYRVNISTILDNYLFNKILARIKLQHYSIFHQKNMIYCYKGLIGRIAPIVVHFSMILILIGTVTGSIYGFKSQETIPKSEHFFIQNILANGPITFIPQVSARVNDFWITYTKTKTISQFYSDVSILDVEGNEIIRKTISVNHPLIQKGIYYYQTDWDLIGLRVQDSQQSTIEYPLLKVEQNSKKVWLTWISKSDQQKNGVISLVNNLEGYCALYTSQGIFLGILELHETVTLNQFLTLLEIICSTGLQIKTDPGIPLIYSGFFFLMISTLISYITYSQLWMIRKDSKLFIGGTTNRANFDFELEFFKFIQL